MPHSLKAAFPIPSQTIVSDKLFLLGAARLMREHAGEYRYIEIGSYLGGSLTPFLLDAACKAVLSVDERGRVQPDERGISYDYTAITEQTMLDNLAAHQIPTQKLKTFDGAISALTEHHGEPFDLAFIDGEHTDEATFRDFLWTLPLMRSDAVIMCHDSALIFKALRLTQIYLRSQKIGYEFFKGADSEMSAFVLGRYRELNLAAYFGTSVNPVDFFRLAEAERIKAQFRNRMRVRFAPQKLMKLKIPVMIEIGPPNTTSGV
jgi:Methyltransferase domain